MKVSQLLKVMDKDDKIFIDHEAKPITKNRIYQGLVRGIKRDDPINKMHVSVIYPCDNNLLILVAEPSKKGDE